LGQFVALVCFRVVGEEHISFILAQLFKTPRQANFLVNAWFGIFLSGASGSKESEITVVAIQRGASGQHVVVSMSLPLHHGQHQTK
jgi:hypothetical protein